MTERRILLADCDQMFVTVARLVDPEGAGQARLLVVGGSATSRGVVCSASYEVRAFGVRSGMSIARAARLCPRATFVPVPGKACQAKSREVRAVLDRWTPTVEAASIDEFYLDLTGTEALYRQRSLEEVARQIREEVLAVTGMRLSIGGGTNRLVAKLGAERAKPRPGTGGTGVLIVPPGQEAAFLASHDLAQIPGVGPRLQAKLARYGLRRVTEALPITEAEFSSWLGPRTGPWLHARIRGLGSAAVEARGEAKSMSREETFPADLDTRDALETELLRLTTRLGQDLRQAGLLARCVSVKLRDADFKTRQASRTLPEPTDVDREVFGVARELLAKLFGTRRRRCRLIGIALTQFREAGSRGQLSLFDRPGTAPIGKDRAVGMAVDEINRRFGHRTVRPARLGTGERPR